VTIKIWGITEGPYSIDEMPDEEEYPEDSEYFVVCKIELDGKIEEVNFWFEDLEDIYEWKKYFSKNIEPLEIDEDHKKKQMV
tara:strand:- start:815 stop:1060 length:246 start_codon:yes stop_codon:yes gene_type:complete